MKLSENIVGDKDVIITIYLMMGNTLILTEWCRGVNILGVQSTVVSAHLTTISGMVD